jgi:adiponectin receptor
MSGDYYLLFARFDYAGINILISGSVIPPLYYGLYCHQALAKFYIVCIAIIAVTLFTASLFKFMHTSLAFYIFKVTGRRFLE